MRTATMLLGLVAACAALAASVQALQAAPDRPTSDKPAPAEKKQAHPLYDDGGTLDWRTSLEQAMKVAGDRRRLIFIEWGRES